jgi:anti-anti-sigma factor
MIDHLAPGDHVSWVYDSLEEYRAQLVDWACDGLRQGERVICIDRDGDVSRLWPDLDRAGIDAREAAERSRLAVVPTAQGAVRLASVAGCGGTRIARDAAASGLGCADAPLGMLSATGLASVLCLFPRAALTLRTGTRLAVDHPCRIADGCAELVRSGTVVHVRGEIDRSNAHLLAAVLESARLCGGDVTVDLSERTFMDLGGVRALLDAADRLGRAQRLVVVAPSRTLLRILHVLGGDRVKNLLVRS